MKKLITASLAAATLVASLAVGAAAGPMAPAVTPALPSHESGQIGISRSVSSKPAPTDESGFDRTFHPDYSHALTPEQRIAAWNDEVNRVMQTPISGGG